MKRIAAVRYVAFTGDEFDVKADAEEAERKFIEDYGIADTVEALRAEGRYKGKTLSMIEDVLIYHVLRRLERSQTMTAKDRKGGDE